MFFGRRRPDPASRPDSDAFTSEALELLDSLYGTALRLTRDVDRAEDLVQDTYLKAFRARRRFAAGTNLKAWLFTILYNTWRNRRRDQARSRVAFDSEALDEANESLSAVAASTPDSPEALLLRADMEAELKAALDALPEAFRMAVWLRDVEELTYQEIAEALDIPIGTVMSRISRGRRQLCRLLTRTREAQLEALHGRGGRGS